MSTIPSDKFIALMAKLDTPKTLSLAICEKYGWTEDNVSVLDVSPHHYMHHFDTFLPDIAVYQRDQAAVALIKKDVTFKVTGVNPSANAIKTWIQAEQLCFKQGQILDDLWWSQPHENQKYGYRNVLRAAKGIIKDILGKAPALYDVPFPDFGEGATLSNSRKQNSVYHKLVAEPTATEDLVSWFILCQPPGYARVTDDLYEDRSNYDSWIRVVNGNVSFEVPKTFKTKRLAAKGPLINAAFTRGVGLEIERRFSRFTGLSKESTVAVHRELVVTLNDWIATIDLSMASDTVSCNLVKLLLPSDWFQILNIGREKFTYFGDKRVLLEKFSAMGNGYTFELETLIFYSLALAYIRVSGYPKHYEFVSVFGDDIIIPAICGKGFLLFLNDIGFCPNVEKSFISGSFKESCGVDAFGRYVVRPTYIKRTPADPCEWIGLHNRFAADQNLSLSKEHAKFCMDVMRWCINQVPNHLRCYGPPQLGDTVLHTDSRQKWGTRWVPLGKDNRGYVTQMLQIRKVVPILKKKQMECNNPVAYLTAVATGQFNGSSSISLGWKVKWGVLYGIP